MKDRDSEISYIYRWTNYEALGAVIPGTRLITFKVPLKKVCENLNITFEVDLITLIKTECAVC